MPAACARTEVFLADEILVGVSLRTTAALTGRDGERLLRQLFHCDWFSFTAPFSLMRCISLSATWSRTKTCFFTDAQKIVVECRAGNDRLRRARWAAGIVNKTGGLPGPAQMARLPVCIAAFTTIGPPVTSSRRVKFRFCTAH